MARLSSPQMAVNYSEKSCNTDLSRNAAHSYFTSKCGENANPKQFWNCIKPFLSDKSKSHRNIILQEEDRLIADRHDVFNTSSLFYKYLFNCLLLIHIFVPLLKQLVSLTKYLLIMKII